MIKVSDGGNRHDGKSTIVLSSPFMPSYVTKSSLHNDNTVTRVSSKRLINEDG